MRDNADIFGGFSLTPNALATADISAEAKKFMVVMNAATAIITTKSPYIARTSSTTPQLNYVLGQWAAKNGVKTVYTMVSDYGPGIDAETWFQTGFKEGGGTVIGSVRFPVANPDFSAFVQAAKDKNRTRSTSGIPGGTQPAAVGKALAERGVDPSKIKVIGQRRARRRNRAQEHGRRRARHHHRVGLRLQPQIGNEPGIRQSLQRRIPSQPGLLRGRRLRRHAPDLRDAEEDRRQGRRRFADRGGQGHRLAWESPRGPISIDPETRDIIQTVYIRRVQKVGDKLQNIEFDKVENVKDPAKARMTH